MARLIETQKTSNAIKIKADNINVYTNFFNYTCIRTRYPNFSTEYFFLFLFFVLIFINISHLFARGTIVQGLKNMVMRAKRRVVPEGRRSIG